MTGVPDHHDATESRPDAQAPVQYPTNHVLGVVDTREQANPLRAALTSGGFLDSGIQVETGAARADEVNASTGRRGLADMLIRFAERIGATNEEMETKDVYEHAMRDNRFVLPRRRRGSARIACAISGRVSLVTAAGNSRNARRRVSRVARLATRPA